MKFSLNAAQFYSNVPIRSLDTDKLVEKIGAQLGAVEEVEAWGPRYDGILLVKVVECVKHPNADKLHVCKVDDGGVAKNVARDENGLVQVVCGAPNVHAGMLAAWLPPGTTVPATIHKDPFVLTARDFRGQMSNGMLASLSELGIGDDHSGLLEITAEDVGKDLAKPGTPFKQLHGLDDVVIDIENKMFTHRPDCFGQMGVARELAGITHKAFKSPEWYLRQNSFTAVKGTEVKGLSVKNEVPKLCPRYMAVAIENVRIHPSPVWMQAGLARMGVRPINNIVDLTNWIMLVTAQPLHAFDFDKVAVNGKAQIVIRNPKKGEKMQLLDNKTIQPRGEAILICDQDKPIALGGVMGGGNSEIDANTKNIIIECANFDMYNIRKTSMEHGIFTDAVTRFNKGQSAEQCAPVLYYALELLQQLLPEARIIGRIVENYPKASQNDTVTVTADFVNERLGTKLSLKEMTTLLENVEFTVKNAPADKKHIYVQAPFWRTDIHIPEDIVEEIGRLYGYDHLPLELPKRDLTPVDPNPLFGLKSQLRNTLAAAGANEVLTYNFIHSNLMEKVGQNTKNAFKLSNAISPDLQYMRMSVLPNLLEKVHSNLKAGYSSFALFEMGTVHNKDLMDDDGLPVEEHRLGLVFAADQKASKPYKGAPYYQVRRYVDELANQLGINVVYEPATSHTPKLEVGKAAIAPFDPNRAAYIKTVDGELLGEIGEFKPSVRKALKLPDFAAGFELDIERLLKNTRGTVYQALSRFPSIEQDISLKVTHDQAHQTIFNALNEQLQTQKPDDCRVSVSTKDLYQSEDAKHMTFTVLVVSDERTLKTEVVNTLLDHAADVLNSSTGAERL